MHNIMVFSEGSLLNDPRSYSLRFLIMTVKRQVWRLFGQILISVTRSVWVIGHARDALYCQLHALNFADFNNYEEVCCTFYRRALPFCAVLSMVIGIMVYSTYMVHNTMVYCSVNGTMVIQKNGTMYIMVQLSTSLTCRYIAVCKQCFIISNGT